jgi:hypothetical protein
MWSSKVAGILDKVSGPTRRSAGLLTGWVHLVGTSRTLVAGDLWVPVDGKNSFNVSIGLASVQVTYVLLHLREIPRFVNPRS